MPRPTPSILAAVAAALIATAASGSPGQPPASAPATAQPQPIPASATPADLLTLITDPASAPPIRDRAADRLIAFAESHREAADLIRVHLATAGPAAPSTAALFRAVARAPVAADALFEPFTAVLSQASADQLPGLLPALASWRTREALRLLLAYANPGQPAPVRDAAFQALARLTGRDDLGANAEAWSRYADESASLSEAQWETRLTAALAARADALAARESAALARVTDSLRRLYLSTPSDQRSTLLATLLLDDLEQTRALGFELAARELSSTHRLDQPVAEACLKLLTHASARARQNAALLLYQLSPPGAGPAISAALAHESDPEAAAALLAASERWPDPANLARVTDWLSRADTATLTRVPAARAALALARAGYLYDADARDHILSAIRGLPPGSLPPAAGPLLILLGDDDDRAAAARLLTADSPALRVATAEAAVVYPELLPSLLAAAEADPQLWDAAVRAATMHAASAESFFELAALPASSPDARREGLRFFASVLPAGQIIAAAEKLPGDDPLRELVLTPLLDPARRLSLNPESPAYQLNVRGLLMLARARLDARRPDEALLALDAAPDPTDPADVARLTSLRARALLALGRAEQALALNASADDWLDGLEPVADDRDTLGLIEVFASAFDSLSPQQQQRLEAIRARAAAAPAPETVGPPPS